MVPILIAAEVAAFIALAVAALRSTGPKHQATPVRASRDTRPVAPRDGQALPPLRVRRP